MDYNFVEIQWHVIYTRTLANQNTYCMRQEKAENEKDRMYN